MKLHNPAFRVRKDPSEGGPRNMTNRQLRSETLCRIKSPSTTSTTTVKSTKKKKKRNYSRILEPTT